MMRHFYRSSALVLALAVVTCVASTAVAVAAQDEARPGADALSAQAASAAAEGSVVPASSAVSVGDAVAGAIGDKAPAAGADPVARDAAAATEAAVADTAAPAVDVAALWKRNCSACHGSDGKGQTNAGRKARAADFTAADVSASFDRDRMIEATAAGIPGEDGGRPKMKPYGERLSGVEISALVDFILALAP
jgi:mono/diheme cytochrome c family protein